MYFFVWDATNEEKIDEHGVTKDEAEEVVNSDLAVWKLSRSSDRDMPVGWTSTGKLIAVPLDYVDAITVRVATAYEVEEV